MVSIVIPNYNGKTHLNRCFRSISNQTFRDFEVVVVDNGSSDGSVEFTRSVFPNAKLVCNQRNLGFAAPVNQGVNASSGTYVFILNNDTALDDRCLENLLGTMNESKRSRGKNVIGLAPKTLFFDRAIIDSVGNAINPDGSVFNVGIGQVDLGQFDRPRRVFGLCFAAAFIERSAFDRVGLVDESYFAYLEDVDWCYRANMLGYEFYTSPNAVVRHYHSGTTRALLTNDQKYYLLHRNLIRTLLKNYSLRNLRPVLRKIMIHVYHTSGDLLEMRFAKAKIQARIAAVSLLWLPTLLLRNLIMNRGRALTDREIWGLSAERIVQISGDTFHAETYSPYVSLDVVEEILQYLAQKVGRDEYLEAYLGVHAINYLRRQGFLRLAAWPVTRPTGAPSKSRILCANGLLGYTRGGRLFIRHRGQSFMVDTFLLNLLLLMKDRTIEEVTDLLVASAFDKERKTGAEDVTMRSQNVRQLIDLGLRSIATYLAKTGLIAGELTEHSLRSATDSSLTA